MVLPLGFLFFVITMWIKVNAVSPEEGVALCSFISAATLPQNWICNNTESSCTWTGITCSNETITEINLVNGQITGTLPTQIGLLNNLQILDLSNNHISGTIPTNLGSLSALVTLELDNNYLSGTIPTQLGLLSLNTINLKNNNQLCGCLPSTWQSQSWTQCDLTGVILHCNCSIPPSTSCTTSLCSDVCNVCSVFYENNVNTRGCTCLAGYLKNGITCEEIDECALYHCSSGSLNTNCTQPEPNQRICTCPTGYTVDLTGNSSQSSFLLFGNALFEGCAEINECEVYQCQSGSLATNCMEPAINQRKCTCPTGYTLSPNNVAAQPSIVLNGNSTFVGCVEIDECSLYKCPSNGPTVTCSQPAVNQRICTCPAGYTTTGNPDLYQPTFVVLNGNASFAGCTDINECAVYGCSSGDIPTNCTQPPINKRICECPYGYTVGPTASSTVTTVVLFGNDNFTGCIEVNDCLAYGCNDTYSLTNTSCVDRFLQRTCECVPGYSTQNSTSTVNNITLHPDQTFKGCIEIDECYLYQCVDIVTYTSTRCEGGINNRTCVCPNGYSAKSPISTIPSVQLVADTPFGGCYGISDCAVYGCHDTISKTKVACLQAQFNVRECTCLPGYTTDKKDTIVTPSILLVGNATFKGCTDIDECALYGCGNLSLCTTTKQHPDERDCTCPAGFDPYNSSIITDNTITVFANDSFEGCTETDQCLVYGCEDLINNANTTCVNGINQRICGCPIGYTTGNTKTIAPNITLIGSESFNGCNEIDECGVHGCYYLNFKMSCTQKEINKRNCTCPKGYTTSTNSSNISPTEELVGSAPFSLGCYDIDECTAYVKPCSTYSFCVNSVGSYNCSGCPSGEIANGPTCVDANECLLGTHDCNYILRPCINLYRTFECQGCPSGYTNLTLLNYGQFPVYLTCADIDECNGTNLCDRRPCFNTIGSYYCGACIPGWEVSGLYDCKTICGDGIIIAGYEACDTGKFTSIGCLSCKMIEPHWYCETAGLPCYFDTNYINVSPTHSDIVTVFTNGYSVANKGLNSLTNVVWNDYTNEIYMNFSTNMYCNSSDFNNTLNIIKNVSLQSLGGAFSYKIFTTIDNETGFCNISEIFIQHPELPNTWLLPLLVVIACLLAICIVVGVLIWRRKINNIILPPELKKFIDFDRVYHRYKKLNMRQIKTPYYYHSIKFNSGSKEEEFLNYLLDKLDFDRNIKIRRAYAVISMVLFQNLSNMRQIQISRFKNNPNLFYKTSWKNNDPNGFRQFTIERFLEKIKLFSWNRNLNISDSPILPVVHGTNKKVAWHIIASGFSALSTNDDGFYGKGIYFSTSMSYIFPYFSVSNHPTVIVCLTIPGNPYPVTEHFQSSDTLMGKSLIPGYQSHYVLTSGSGHPIKGMSDNHYDELVLAQESQVVPVFLINVDRSNFKELKQLCRRGGIKSDISPREDEKDNGADLPSSEEDPNEPNPENITPIQSTIQTVLSRITSRYTPKTVQKEDIEQPETLEIKPMKEKSKSNKLAASNIGEKEIEGDAANCCIEPLPGDNNALTRAQENIDRSFLLKVYDKMKKPCLSDEIVISCYEPDNFQHTITQVDTGVYLVKYKFKEAGDVTLQVKIGGKDITGSPFNISVLPETIVQ